MHRQRLRAKTRRFAWKHSGQKAFSCAPSLTTTTPWGVEWVTVNCKISFHISETRRIVEKRKLILYIKCSLLKCWMRFHIQNPNLYRWYLLHLSESWSFFRFVKRWNTPNPSNKNPNVMRRYMLDSFFFQLFLSLLL